MLTIQGIYNGKNIELSETVPFKEKKKVLVTFLEDKSEKQIETKRPAQVLLELFGLWEDNRDAEEIVSEIKQARKNSANLRDGF